MKRLQRSWNRLTHKSPVESHGPGIIVITNNSGRPERIIDGRELGYTPADATRAHGDHFESLHQSGQGVFGAAIQVSSN